MKSTEQRNERSAHIHTMPLAEALALINDENRRALDAVDAALPQIAAVCEMMEHTVKNGGRIFYVGAGTSGRLGVLDAVECPPTFGVSQDLFIGVLAGGYACLATAGESNEDSAVFGRRDIVAAGVKAGDFVLGISAAGDAAYVVGALEYAKSCGASTAGLVNNRDTFVEKCADLTIFVDSGAEVITGSTRMKAGTTQKVVLNMLSTMTMVRCGYVYENLMINVKPTNRKLRERGINIVCELCRCEREAAVCLLDAHGWNIREVVLGYGGNQRV